MKRFFSLLICFVLSGFINVGHAASGNCDPESLDKLPAKKRAMIEQKCQKSKERNELEKQAAEIKWAWAKEYFKDKPAMFEVFKDRAKQIHGCKNKKPDCQPRELDVSMHQATATKEQIIWIDRYNSSQNPLYTCNEWRFSLDGKDLLDYKTYRC